MKQHHILEEQGILPREAKKHTLSDKKMNVYFVVRNKNFGSSLMRAYQIQNELSKSCDNIRVVELKNIESLYEQKKSYFIWIGPIGIEHISKFKMKHVHILDLIDKYLSNTNTINEALQKNVYSYLFVNNKYMKRFFSRNHGFQGKIFVLHHHYDTRYEKTITNVPSNKLQFGYMGSILSLLHTDNFLHYKKIGQKYNVQFFDTENGEIMDDYVYDDNKLKNFKKNHKHSSENIPSVVSINCQISIRNVNGPVAKFKTTAKMATAIVLGHNIITTYEESVKDILPPDYPFLLHSTDFESVDKMFRLVQQDYYSDKKLWNKGLAMLKEAKSKLSIQFIARRYRNILKI